MTDTIITADNTGGDDQHQPHLGTLEHLRPQDLVIDDNVRDDAAIDPDFAASVKEHGVLVPIAVVRGDDGIVRVRAGQRRTVAARQADLTTVPVYVRPATAGDEKVQVVERVAEQIVENDQRKSLTEAQRAKGIQQMLDAGVSVTKVAKKLSVHRDTVKAAAAAAGSTAAMDGLDTGQISLAEAAAITEFDDDPAAVDELLRAAGGRMFGHKVEQLRQSRASALAYAEAAASYTAQGYSVIEQSPTWNDLSCVALHHLRTTDGEAVTEAAITDSAKWAVRLYEEEGYADRETGDLVDEATIDWDTENDSDAEPNEGMRHVDSVVEKTVFVPDWFCLDYAGVGLDLTPSLKRRPGTVGGGADDDGDDEAARERAEAEQAQAAKRERSKVIALNKLGNAAQVVRREFVKDKLLSRKTPLKGAAMFVAQCLTRDQRLLEEYRGSAVAAELLGVADTPAVKKLIADLGNSGDGRAQVIILGLVLGALEARTPKDAWRSGSAGGVGYHVGAADYLTWLALNGYRLSPIEDVITGARRADDVYEDNLRKEDAAA